MKSVMVIGLSVQREPEFEVFDVVVYQVGFSQHDDRSSDGVEVSSE